jgi:hypothetical protein
VIALVRVARTSPRRERHTIADQREQPVIAAEVSPRSKPQPLITKAVDILAGAGDHDDAAVAIIVR